MTFAEAARLFMDAKSGEWSNPKHRQQWANTLDAYAIPVLGKMLVSDVRNEHVLTILRPIWEIKTETASRLRGRIEQILDWATAQGYREGLNPARWRGHLDKILPRPSKIAKVEHHEAVSLDDLPGFVADLKGMAGTAARALEFLILTAARSGEVRGAQWSEFDLDAGVWTVPAERMKAKREHRVPLSVPALQILKAQPVQAGSAIVFPGSKGQVLSDMTLTAVMRRMKVEAVPHGFRSTFRDWAGERTDFPSDLAEMALAHTIPNKVEAAYRRGDMLAKRAAMMTAWADFALALCEAV